MKQANITENVDDDENEGNYITPKEEKFGKSIQ